MSADVAAPHTVFSPTVRRFSSQRPLEASSRFSAVASLSRRPIFSKYNPLIMAAVAAVVWAARGEGPLWRGRHARRSAPPQTTEAVGSDCCFSVWEKLQEMNFTNSNHPNEFLSVAVLILTDVNEAVCASLKREVSHFWSHRRSFLSISQTKMTKINWNKYFSLWNQRICFHVQPVKKSTFLFFPS